jgi:predicted transcriptional regulator
MAQDSDEHSHIYKGSIEGKSLQEVVTEKAGVLKPHDSLQTASEVMRELGTDACPVAEGRTLVGMAESQHADVHAIAHGHDPKLFRIGESMNRDAIFCYEDEDCGRARQILAERDLTYLPIVDREMRIVGMVGRAELEKLAARESIAYV